MPCVRGREGGVCGVCMCGRREGGYTTLTPQGEKVSTHPNSNSLDEDTRICLHNHSVGEHTNCHTVVQDNRHTISSP